jgi:hypothetical protein
VSGSIFGDDDDFELVGGSDTPSAIRKPPVKTPVARPVTRPTPPTSNPTADVNRNTNNRSTPGVASPTALPRPQMPSATRKLPAGRVLPKISGAAKVPTNQEQERVDSVNQTAPEIREVSIGDINTSRRKEASQQAPLPREVPDVVAPIDEYASNDTPNPKDHLYPSSNNRSFEQENIAPDNTPITRRSVRSNPSNHYDDVVPDHDLVPQIREETPRNFYTQNPYTPVENLVPVPPRVEQPHIEQQPQSHSAVRTSPAVENLTTDAPLPVKKPAKANRLAKPTKAKEAKNKGPGSFSGGRAGVVVVRVFAITVVAILLLAGTKSVFFPTQIPDPTTVTNVVKKRLGVTNFPTENGQAFVTSFARIYFTVDPTNTNSTDAYTPYMSSSLASSMTASNGTEAKQTITEGPIVSGVKSIDDENAVYTVGAKLSTGNWMYIDIPVYYDKDNVGFAISGMPAFAPAPAKITAPPAGAPFTPDTKLADTIKSSVMEQFFPAWAASNTAGINLVVLGTANSEAKIGLSNSVKFVSIQSFSVEQKQPDDPEENTRKAQATVVWASPTDAKINYTQQYNLTLFRQPDNRWYIKELTSGVRS